MTLKAQLSAKYVNIEIPVYVQTLMSNVQPVFSQIITWQALVWSNLVLVC